ncbi:reticulon-4-like isoform X8 [Syngnathoides biaculeatus]|uniref:reticulon-4-like isoform X8 n=1 Tax=Syngnathoides biaculeatus TaxID=300417 RepID=UPI002ADE6ADB|nr:reticulon-4-like isoform X8 [Syngnathoides biaculeatus]
MSITRSGARIGESKSRALSFQLCAAWRSLGFDRPPRVPHSSQLCRRPGEHSTGGSFRCALTALLISKVDLNSASVAETRVSLTRVGQRKMADNEERQVSSSSAFFSDDVHHYQPEQDLYSLDDIVDLVGGAQDALERHMAEDGEPRPFAEPREERQPAPVPQVREMEEEGEGEGEGDEEQEEERREEREQLIPDSTASVPRAPSPPAESDALLLPQPAAQPPVDTHPAPAPASCGLHRWKLNVDRRVADLVYWRDVKTTGVVFGAALLLLLSLTVCSIVSVCSYVGLALLSVTVCFRIYKGILQAIQKSDEGHPFKQYLEREVALSEDMVHKYGDVLLEKINKTVSELRRLFLVEDLVDSIKFAVLMWVLTYVGAIFNGLTLVILAVIAAFSCPIIYEKHQAQIDHYLALINNQIKDVIGKIQAKVPGMKRKPE